MDLARQQRKNSQSTTREEARMPTRRGPTWETEKELQMHQAQQESLEGRLEFQKPGKEKTQQTREKESIR